MNVALSARAWFLLLFVDVIAFVLVALGLSLGMALLTVAGVAMFVATSVAAVLVRSRRG